VPPSLPFAGREIDMTCPRVGLSFIAALVTVASCASVGVTCVRPGASKPRACPLEVFTSEAEIRRPFEVACLIDSRTGTTAFHSKDAATAIEIARPEACVCGADGLLVVNVDTEGATMATWGRGKAILKAVRFTTPPPVVSAPAPLASQNTPAQSAPQAMASPSASASAQPASAP